jgi:hypothetical protein
MEEKMATDLLSCLQAQRWHFLRSLARANGWPFDSNLSLAQAANHLGALLSRGATFPDLWSALSAEARSALVALLEAGGYLPQEEFVHRFGPVRRYRPWRPDASPAPWEAPQSPAEAVVFRGLAYRVNLGTAKRPAWAAVLPDEFHAPLTALAQLVPAPVSASLQPPPPPSAHPALAGDLFAFLSLLHRRDVRPIWGRWLPPTALRELNRFLSRSEALAGVRSERDAPYLAFLHYLAERAGLVHLSGHVLKPTLVAHEWLAAPSGERLARLWTVWTEEDAANGELWQCYRLPGWTLENTLPRFRRLLEHLARRPPGHGLPTADLLDRLADADPPLFRVASYTHWAGLSEETRAEYQAEVRAFLTELLDGPLTWFGVLDGDPPALTPLGAALLGREDGRWPEAPPLASLAVSPRLVETDAGASAIRLTAPPGLPLPARLALEALVPPNPAHPGRYDLTRPRLLQALQKGHTVEGIVNNLEGAAADPLPLAVVGAIYRWAEEQERLAVRQVVLLEAQDPELLQALARPKRIRETLGETLSARAVRVHADRLPALLRRLAARGYYPRLDIPPTPGPSPVHGRGDGEGAIIAVALRVYAELADALNLPLRPPHALARAWIENLSLPQRDAAERAVAEALDHLRRAAPPKGDYRLPPPTGPLLDALEQAIAEGATVEMRYYTAGREHEMTRRVDPLRLEWRGEVAYLVAHCHLRGEQRVFRVDRIAELEILPQV